MSRWRDGTRTSAGSSRLAGGVCPGAGVLGRDNELPINVFDMTRRGNIQRVVCGEAVGTRIVKDNLGTRFSPE